MERVCELFRVSERRVCRIVRQARSTQRYQPRCRDDEERLTARVVELASLYGRHGYSQVWGLLRMEGWGVNRKRVERIWRQEAFSDLLINDLRFPYFGISSIEYLLVQHGPVF